MSVDFFAGFSDEEEEAEGSVVTDVANHSSSHLRSVEQEGSPSCPTEVILSQTGVASPLDKHDGAQDEGAAHHGQSLSSAAEISRFLRDLVRGEGGRSEVSAVIDLSLSETTSGAQFHESAAARSDRVRQLGEEIALRVLDRGVAESLGGPERVAARLLEELKLHRAREERRISQKEPPPTGAGGRGVGEGGDPSSGGAGAAETGAASGAEEAAPVDALAISGDQFQLLDRGRLVYDFPSEALLPQERGTLDADPYADHRKLPQRFVEYAREESAEKLMLAELADDPFRAEDLAGRAKFGERFWAAREETFGPDNISDGGVFQLAETAGDTALQCRLLRAAVQTRKDQLKERMVKTQHHKKKLLEAGKGWVKPMTMAMIEEKQERGKREKEVAARGAVRRMREGAERLKFMRLEAENAVLRELESGGYCENDRLREQIRVQQKDMGKVREEYWRLARAVDGRGGAGGGGGTQEMAGVEAGGGFALPERVQRVLAKERESGAGGASEEGGEETGATLTLTQKDHIATYPADAEFLGSSSKQSSTSSKTAPSALFPHKKNSSATSSSSSSSISHSSSPSEISSSHSRHFYLDIPYTEYLRLEIPGPIDNSEEVSVRSLGETTSEREKQDVAAFEIGAAIASYLKPLVDEAGREEEEEHDPKPPPSVKEQIADFIASEKRRREECGIGSGVSTVLSVSGAESGRSAEEAVAVGSEFVARVLEKGILGGGSPGGGGALRQEGAAKSSPLGSSTGSRYSFAELPPPAPWYEFEPADSESEGELSPVAKNAVRVMDKDEVFLRGEEESGTEAGKHIVVERLEAGKVEEDGDG